MYHRNKVHTDEFWMYELAKNNHRRSVGSGSGTGRECTKQESRFADSDSGFFKKKSWLLVKDSVSVIIPRSLYIMLIVNIEQQAIITFIYTKSGSC